MFERANQVEKPISCERAKVPEKTIPIERCFQHIPVGDDQTNSRGYPMGTTVKTVKAIELVFDWNLWPRHKAEVLDATNVAQLRDALRAGMRLPPIVVSVKDMRIVDGFHRTRAALDVFGDKAEIEAELREYKNEGEMFLEAGALNNHGLKLSPMDRAHFILKARKLKVPPEAIAQALGMDAKNIKEFIEKRSAKTSSGETIPLPGGARNLAGKTLTQQQEHFARTTGGNMPEMYASMLINALRADALILNEKTVERLKTLAAEIQRVLDEAAA